MIVLALMQPVGSPFSKIGVQKVFGGPDQIRLDTDLRRWNSARCEHVRPGDSADADIIDLLKQKA
jgi:hypothetical protein